jgi:hypothetical protein
VGTQTGNVGSSSLNKDGCLLGSQVLMWQVLGIVLGASFASFGFAWLLSLPTWGLMLMG